MSVILIFLAGIAAIITWWMAQQRLTSRPWLEAGSVGDTPRYDVSSIPTAKIGLGVFLAVVGALFTLFISAYFMRMGLQDWWAIPVPGLLWVNTIVLALSSVALQWAKIEAEKHHIEAMRTGLLIGLATAIGFLVGQLFVWRELVSAGYVLADNPANSFFYLITGMHGLHILGGLVALGRTTFKAWHAEQPGKVLLSVELCAMYWHFMLLVWLVLFALFAGWANDFVDICRQLLT
ncbi:cytochrome-c oxidase [Phyllobacterium brassicacearum]|uniref:Cytochrome-c oxidase n=1 Tax=Phyllobacterium brassicacearum TaxID=314235 RepID=A0A2P7BQT3_9HYPH|nr:cytochrome c oxidase subunit 3 [Phyllobacterium brassicacearum]PSH68828.1 cytochrome-c oxidase [Phyllobacterium brassicacearum]TDQ33560.1 cytochrome c oxidase subunit 3 [Phyllobacterium brassicacearum]